jgi:hypothetical protein
MEPIYASEKTNFTITLKLENLDPGFVAYRNEDGTEDTVYKYYIMSMSIGSPDTWTAIHPDQWSISQKNNITTLSLTTLEEFMDCTQCGCPTGYTCDQSNIKRCYAGDNYVDANSCENLDRRLYLVRGERVNFGIGFQRDAVAVETVENVNVGIDYSYAVTTPTSLDITVRGQEQTY